MCGWLKDRFGFSWQVVPKQLFETIGGSDAEGRKRAMAAMMQMRKLDVGTLVAAYEGKAAA
jgi:predicted 3-demethylubiquinone-9 3-methyltransferase (glyoxalase superfamily)